MVDNTQIEDMMAANDMAGKGPNDKLVRNIIDMAIAGHPVDELITNLNPVDKAELQKQMTGWAENYDQSGSMKSTPRLAAGVPANTGDPIISRLLDKHFGPDRTRPQAK